MSPRIVAFGDGWTAADVICTAGPDDRSFEEQHSRYAIAVVLAGSFQYRSPLGPTLMTPGSLMLGNSGQCFECGHAHGEGDRCVSFWYEAEYFERLLADAGVRGRARFAIPRLPPVRTISSLVTGAALAITSPTAIAWDEFSITLATRTFRVSSGLPADVRGAPLNGEARVTQAVRAIDRHPAALWTVQRLASEARLSPYHFLRTFAHLTGVTPHQYLLRARLRHAAVRLVHDAGSVLDIALDSGFGDLSNFTRAFRTEFGVSPGQYRRRSGRR
jgi:AraC-like DNA-binding protein